jgi:hypothetical protein
MIKRTATAAVLATAALAATAAPAPAQDDVCVGPIDFTGRMLCVLEEVGHVRETARPILQEHDPCITYDFTGRQLCPIGDTIGYGD